MKVRDPDASVTVASSLSAEVSRRQRRDFGQFRSSGQHADSCI